MEVITGLVFTGINPEIEKNKIINQPIVVYQDETTNEDTTCIKDWFLLHKDQDSIEDQIKREIGNVSIYNQADVTISASVYNNSIKIIDAIFPSLLNDLDPMDIYTTDYGTIVLDWEKETDNVFSLEIGKKSIGYFYEFENVASNQIDELLIDDENFNKTIYKINHDLSMVL